MWVHRLMVVFGLLTSADDVNTPATPQVRLESVHPWRPPFGLARIGRPQAAVVEFPGAARPAGRYWLALVRDGGELSRITLEISEQAPYRARVPLGSPPDALVLYGVKGDGAEAEVITRRQIARPAIEIEAEAVARPDGPIVNPVDLGTILVPDGWVLRRPDQAIVVEIAAIDRHRDLPNARLRARFDSAPRTPVFAPIPLKTGERGTARFTIPPKPLPDRDVLHVDILGGVDEVVPAGKPIPTVWGKSIPVMTVADPPRLLAFGATALKLRFDAAVSVRDPRTGAFSSLDYETAWDAKLNDVVVSLPNGSRFVFWRGSSYIPFWAGRHNTGLCYEWAENLGRPADAVDCVEPLMDKELRYGRVEIVESTPARVHVRWSYQSTDLHYQVWGDSAVEDYYFYPDGFGTRVLSLKADPAAVYELSEFIVIAPQDAYPLAFLPTDVIDVLLADGTKSTIAFPIDRERETKLREAAKLPAIYRVRTHKDDRLSAIQFNPMDRALPPLIFGPFLDRGELVTPAYWGSHWPLARGNATGSAIDDRIHLTPSHNSLMSWAKSRPEPISIATAPTLDALGRSKTMVTKRWAWLIGMTADNDSALRARAASWAQPPAIDIVGGRIDPDAYSLERRALRIRPEAREIALRCRIEAPWVNPVIELIDAPKGRVRISRASIPLDPGGYAWDGRVLWLRDPITTADTLRITFEAGEPPE